MFPEREKKMLVESKTSSLRELLSEVIDNSLKDNFPISEIPPEMKSLIPLAKKYIEISLFQKDNIVFPYNLLQNYIRPGIKNIDFLQSLSITIAHAVRNDQFKFLQPFLEDKECREGIKKIDISKLRGIEPELKNGDLFHYAIASNSLNTLYQLKTHLDWKVTFSHLETAVEYHSEEVFKYLLSEYKPSPEEIERLAARAKSLGNITILDQLKPSPLYYFKSIVEMIDASEDEVKTDLLLKKNVFNLVSHAYRFTLNMSDVNSLCDRFISNLPSLSLKNKERIKAVEESIKEATAFYLEWGGVVAPYRSPDHLKVLGVNYNAPTNFEGKNIEKEIEFGKQNVRLVDELFRQESKLETASFLSFDQIMAYINQYNGENAKKREIQSGGDLPFGVIREEDLGEALGTIIHGQYDGVTPYIQATYENIGQIPDAQLTENGYDMMHNNHLMTAIYSFLGNNFKIISNHGRGDPKEILPVIRKLHDELCLMDSKEIEKDPSEFYKKISDVLSLTGKLTPFLRGTGRLVETWLAYIHRKKGMHCPILRKIQLDCINISLPTSIEEKLLLYFFKRESLSKSAQAYLDKLSENPEIDKLLQYYKLGKYENTLTQEVKKAEELADDVILERFLSQNVVDICGKDSKGIDLITWAAKNKPDIVDEILLSPKFKLEIDLVELLKKLKNDFPDKISPKSFLSLKPVTDIITVAFDNKEEAKTFATVCKQYGADSQGKTRLMYGKHPTDPKKFVAFISLSKDVPILLKKTGKKDLTTCLSMFKGTQTSNPAWKLTFSDEKTATLFTNLYGKTLASVTAPGAVKSVSIEKTGIFTSIAKVLLTPRNLIALKGFEVPKTQSKELDKAKGK